MLASRKSRACKNICGDAATLAAAKVLQHRVPQARSFDMRFRARGFACAIRKFAAFAIWTGLALGTAHVARADEINVAVAANLLGTLQKLGALFQRAHGHTVLPSPGSSGQLYAQIQRGAPFDVLLSADSERPAKLEAEGLAV